MVHTAAAKVMVKVLLCIISAISAASVSTPHAQITRAATGVSVNAKGILLKQAVRQSQEEPGAHSPRVLSALVEAPKAEQAAPNFLAADVSKPQSVTSTLWNAMKGGLAGMGAGVVQVLCLMWLKTVMNWQYFHGGSLIDAFRTLWAEGGIARFYQGTGIALVQVPLATFGFTFVQTGIVGLVSTSGHLVQGLQATLVVAILGALWRVLIAPLDTLKTTWQVHGSSAKKMFDRRLHVSGPSELWAGSSALFFCQLMAKLPWWGVYNLVLGFWSQPASPAMAVFRNGLAGMLAQMASDAVTNSIRVLKVKRQATVEGEGYFADAEGIVKAEGVRGLFLRGLAGRLLLGSVHGALFSVLWNIMLGGLSHGLGSSAGAGTPDIISSHATHLS